MVTKKSKPSKSRVKTAKGSRYKTATDKSFSPHVKFANVHRSIDGAAQSVWRSPRFDKGNWEGLQVWVPVDPYTIQERQEFRTAMSNPYVWRANRIITKLVAGQGYTTDVVPREEEEVEKDQLEQWQKTKKFKVPYLNKEMTPEQIKDFIDKKSKDMDLAEQVFNGYFTSREQGRCVLGLTPIDRDEDGRWQFPTSIRYIRPEFTLRPFLDANTGEIVGVQIVGLTSNQQFILPIERMLYITNDFNLELFSDYFGDSQVARVVDAANVLNIIFADDFLHAAESTWHQPKVFGVPIQPQDFGNEETVLDEFLKRNENSKGQDIAVTQNSDGSGGVSLLSSSTNAGDIAGLERIVIRCIKVILAFYNLPGFMLSEGDLGSLGGSSNMEEIDMFINTEVLPERIKLENMVDSQLYDKMLSILFDVENADDVPIKLKHKFNKPKLSSIFRADLYEMGKDMVAEGLMDKDGLIEMLGLEEFSKDKINYSQGEDTDPQKNTWLNNRWKQEHEWPNIKLVWEAMPKGFEAPKPWSNQHGEWPKSEVRPTIEQPSPNLHRKKRAV